MLAQMNCTVTGRNVEMISTGVWRVVFIVRLNLDKVIVNDVVN